jgi:hypothetical protein
MELFREGAAMYIEKMITHELLQVVAQLKGKSCYDGEWAGKRFYPADRELESAHAYHFGLLFRLREGDSVTFNKCVKKAWAKVEEHEKRLQQQASFNGIVQRPRAPGSSTGKPSTATSSK